MQRPSSWFRLGMGFSSDGADSQEETLFITGTGDIFGGGSPGLGRIDFTSQSVVPIGGFTGSLSGQNAELTGTGDGRLYGFFTTLPVQVAQIDKASGAILDSKSLPQVATPSAWAFSFWGGDFYQRPAKSPEFEPPRTPRTPRLSSSLALLASLAVELSSFGEMAAH